MLQKAGLMADPVLLGTRSHGYTYELYPLLDRFNYVIALLTIGDKTWYLDASRPVGFRAAGSGLLQRHARVIDREARAINLDPDFRWLKISDLRVFVAGRWTADDRDRSAFSRSVCGTASA